MKSEKEKKCKVKDLDLKQLSMIKALDLDSGLQNVSGDYDFYKKLLLKFYLNYSTFIDEYNKLVVSKKAVEAVHLTHNLKGIAGIIGAKELYLNADKLEQTLVSGNTENEDDLLNRIKVNIEKILDDIKRSGILKKVESGPKKAEMKVDKKDLIFHLEKLIGLLNNYDAESNNQFEYIRPFLEITGFRDECENIEQVIKNYDFDNALKIAKEIKLRLM